MFGRHPLRTPQRRYLKISRLVGRERFVRCDLVTQTFGDPMEMAIVDQFDEAQALIGKDPSKLPAWLPILQQYGPSLYKEARNAIELSVKLVEEWLTIYMFAGQQDGRTKAQTIASFLGDHNQFKSHGRRIGRKVLQDRGAKIMNLEDDPGLHACVLDLYYAIVHTFNGATFKIFENSRGQSLFLSVQQVPVRPPQPGP